MDPGGSCRHLPAVRLTFDSNHSVERSSGESGCRQQQTAGVRQKATHSNIQLTFLKIALINNNTIDRMMVPPKPLSHIIR